MKIRSTLARPWLARGVGEEQFLAPSRLYLRSQVVRLGRLARHMLVRHTESVSQSGMPRVPEQNAPTNGTCILEHGSCDQ